jgi:hypothetical protein
MARICFKTLDKGEATAFLLLLLLLLLLLFLSSFSLRRKHIEEVIKYRKKYTVKPRYNDPGYNDNRG